MIEFILARYNYWIVIILMMTGLYIVFSRGNLVKTIVGLNVFQTSVFIFYITVGKVQGATAPILISDKDTYDDGHGAGYGESHGVGARGPSQGHHGDDHHGATDDHGAMSHDAHDTHDNADHAEPVSGDAAPLSAEDAEAFIRGESANALGDLPEGYQPDEGGQSLHDVDGIDASNSLSSGGTAGAEHGPTRNPNETASPDIEIVTAPDGHELTEQGADILVHTAEAAYSNPLPHVLILTAIVVGVATTSVGLAIAVRIREAYGTIEEDALEKMDNEAEFGPDAEART